MAGHPVAGQVVQALLFLAALVAAFAPVTARLYGRQQRSWKLSAKCRDQARSERSLGAPGRAALRVAVPLDSGGLRWQRRWH